MSKTNFEIIRALEYNTCLWGDALEANYLLSHRFITTHQAKTTKRKIDAYYSKKEREILAGKFDKAPH